MNYFIVGDIHGCYYTLKKLLSAHWNPLHETLLLLGDVVNKGRNTCAVLEYLFKLKQAYPHQFVFLKGNHEERFEQYYRSHLTLATKQKFENYNLDYSEVLDWLFTLPHFLDTPTFLASHAGVSENMQFPLLSVHANVYAHKDPIQNIGKLQVIGHSVVQEPLFDKKTNAFYINTGAGIGKKLSAIKLDSNADVLDVVSLEVSPKDQSNRFLLQQEKIRQKKEDRSYSIQPDSIGST